MLRSTLRHVALLLTAAFAASSLHAQAPSSDPPQTGSQVQLPREPKRMEREQIEELERQFQKAQLAGDIPTVDKLLSEDYLGVNANGELSTKKQQLDHMRNRTLTMTRMDPSDVKIKIIGGQIAIVNSEVDVEGMLDGNALHGLYRYTRVYQRVSGGAWKITSFESTRIRRPGTPPGSNPS